MNLSKTSEFETAVAILTEQLAAFSQSIDSEAAPDNDEILEKVTTAIDNCLAVCKAFELEIGDDSRLLRHSQNEFRVAIQPWFQSSWCMSHALAKPRGYAGDYEMLTCIYNRDVKSRGLGGYLDRYFLNTELGRSVPLRLEMARQFLFDEALVRRQMTVLNIASGPGREYVGDWGLPEDCRLDVACADLDEAALDHLRRKVIPQLPPQITLQPIQHNALKIGNAQQNIAAFGRRDVIYSVGLFDYIPDRLLVRMLRGLHQSVASGGVIYLAFKDCRFYDATKYQWLVDWYFYQRTEEECRQLLVAAGYPDQELSLTRDATGSIINYVCRVSQAIEAPEFSHEDELGSPEGTTAAPTANQA